MVMHAFSTCSCYISKNDQNAVYGINSHTKINKNKQAFRKKEYTHTKERKMSPGMVMLCAFVPSTLS